MVIALVAWLRLGGHVGIASAMKKRMSEGEEPAAYAVASGLLIGGLDTLLAALVLLFALPTAYVLGRSATSIDSIPYFAPDITLFVVGLLVLAVLRTLERIGSAEQEALLLTTVHPRAGVVGLVVAEIAVGAPPLSALAFAVVGVVTYLAAGLLAVGLGAAYPVYEEREFWGTETVVPSTLVMMVYFFVVGPGTIIGLFVAWYTVAGDDLSPLVTGVVVVGDLAVTFLPSYGAYRYACRRYRHYALD